jgi:tetratricopeptide (TPR) repeat protein/uncharacterized integral membrane protein
VGPRLRKLLAAVFLLFALLAVNSAYLGGLTFFSWVTGETYEDRFYIVMFLVHLVLGILIIAPVLVFGILHMRSTIRRKNRAAVRAGLGVFVSAIVLIASGIVLTRLEGVIVIRDPAVREIAYWLHVASPFLAAWLFVLHRLAGKRIRWRVGLAWTGVAVAFAILLIALTAGDPRAGGEPPEADPFFPSLARTASGAYLSADVLKNDEYCKRCHPDIHEDWRQSVHRLSSFNNDPYLASVRETKEALIARDGDDRAVRFCAGCHDPVPLFSGRLESPDFDDEKDPTAHAGITCTVCHAITDVESPRGNGDYVIEEPVHYPFAMSDNAFLSWLSEQLVKGKPQFHKKTFLKPVHRKTEFCGACHKVHLPEEVNAYRWLRGQNHLDSFLLSGVSGMGVASFYYPEKAELNCNGCHMPLRESTDFAAKVRDDSGLRKTLDHQFPSANTAVPVLAVEDGHLTPEEAAAAVEAHREFNVGVMRLDLFALRRGGTLTGELLAPLRPTVPKLIPGESYLVDAVIRTVKMGHLFTQGTSDSNQVWLEVTVRDGDRVIGRSGALGPKDRSVDPWSHFVNSFVLDRDGNRINRRNAQDIFVSLYNNQIPPGAADVVHYRLDVPADAKGPIRIEARLRFRKFDTEYMRIVAKDPDYVNDLPILELAADEVVLPVGDAGTNPKASDIPLWERWNDYGIGLLRKRGRGELRQAEAAFQKVEELGRPDGPLNLARVYLREGRVASEAPAALRRALDFHPPAREWTLLWLTGLVHRRNGRLDEAIDVFRQILDGGFAQAAGRGFDFSKDWRLLNELGSVLYDRARRERGEAKKARRREILAEATTVFLAVLEFDPENVTAHYNLRQIYRELGEKDLEARHAALHRKYKVDDNARDRAVTAARRKYPPADRAAEAVVIYDLHRERR